MKFVLKRVTIAMLLIFCSNTLLTAQQPASFAKDINLPAETCSFGGDFITVGNKIFVHGQSEIFVYIRSNQVNEMVLVATIDLKPKQADGNDNKSFGKYAPPYFDYNFYSPSRQSMVLNDDESLIYTITPDLNLISIGTDDYYDVTKLKDCPLLIEHFKISSGRVIIKYDDLNQRLYTLFSGRDVINKDGSYHVTDSYFAIYDIGFDGSLTLKCEEFKRGFDDYNGVTGDGYFSTASEIEPYRSAGSNLFYLARMTEIILCELPTNPSEPNEIKSTEIDEAKIGKMFI